MTLDKGKDAMITESTAVAKVRVWPRDGTIYFGCVPIETAEDFTCLPLGRITFAEAKEISERLSDAEMWGYLPSGDEWRFS